MRTFAKITCICNLCFLLSIVLRLVEISRQKSGNSNGVLVYQPLESTVVILGYGAIFINLFFILLFLIRYPAKKMNAIPRWLLYFNLGMLPVEFWYFFLSKF